MEDGFGDPPTNVPVGGLSAPDLADLSLSCYASDDVLLVFSL